MIDHGGPLRRRRREDRGRWRIKTRKFVRTFPPEQSPVAFGVVRARQRGGRPQSPSAQDLFEIQLSEIELRTELDKTGQQNTRRHLPRRIVAI
jgi:hypothetical protein